MSIDGLSNMQWVGSRVKRLELMHAKGYLTLTEIAKRWGVPRCTVTLLRKLGLLDVLGCVRSKSLDIWIIPATAEQPARPYQRVAKREGVSPVRLAVIRTLDRELELTWIRPISSARSRHLKGKRFLGLWGGWAKC